MSEDAISVKLLLIKTIETDTISEKKVYINKKDPNEIVVINLSETNTLSILNIPSTAVKYSLI